MRKASRLVFSTKPPAMASRGAKATAWITMSRLPHSRFSTSNAASIWPSTVTSRGIVRREPTDWARGSTRSFILSLTYEKARSAPSRCIACAMPHAIERSVATPTMNARLPERNPMREPAGDCVHRQCTLPAGCDPDRERLTRADVSARAHGVPGENLRDPHLEEPGDPPQRIAGADGIDHTAGAAFRLCGALRLAPVMVPVSSRAPGDRRACHQAQPLSRTQRLPWRQPIQPRERVDVHAVPASDRPQRVTPAHDLEAEVAGPAIAAIHAFCRQPHVLR